jgi:hypothetical protein
MLQYTYTGKSPRGRVGQMDDADLHKERARFDEWFGIRFQGFTQAERVIAWQAWRARACIAQQESQEVYDRGYAKAIDFIATGE